MFGAVGAVWSLLTGSKTIVFLIAGFLALSIAGYTGWNIRDAFCNEAKYKLEIIQKDARIKFLEDRNKKINTILHQDAKAAEVDITQLEKMAKGFENVLSGKDFSGGSCFTKSERSKLRSIFK